MLDLITREELKTKIDGGDLFVLVDTLPEPAYGKGHLPGAINIPSDDILVEAPKRIPDRDADIVVYCGNGPCKRSSLSADRLRRLGYRHVRDYHEGKADWLAVGYPVERELHRQKCRAALSLGCRRNRRERIGHSSRRSCRT